MPRGCASDYIDPIFQENPTLSFRAILASCWCMAASGINIKDARMPATRKEFWTAKLGRNVVRDTENKKTLRRAGWRVLVIWECQTREGDVVARKLKRFLARSICELRAPSPLSRALVSPRFRP